MALADHVDQAAREVAEMVKGEVPGEKRLFLRWPSLPGCGYGENWWRPPYPGVLLMMLLILRRLLLFLMLRWIDFNCSECTAVRTVAAAVKTAIAASSTEVAETAATAAAVATTATTLLRLL